VAYIISANVHRRHLSKGQKAMAVTRARLLNNHSMRNAASAAGVNHSAVAHAQVVIQFALEFQLNLKKSVPMYNPIAKYIVAARLRPDNGSLPFLRGQFSKVFREQVPGFRDVRRRRNSHQGSWIQGCPMMYLAMPNSNENPPRSNAFDHSRRSSHAREEIG